MVDLHWTDPGIIEANEDGTASVRPTPQPDENVSPRTETGRALLDAGSFPEDEGPPTWWSPGDLSPDEMRRRILAIEREASSPALDRWQQGYEDAWKRLHEPDAIHGQCAAPALDVERLAQAWAGHMEKDHPDDDYEAPTTDCAEKVAAEYARLSTPEPSE